jgi:ribosomal protein S18 acetylase RimI-like enzyme
MSGRITAVDAADASTLAAVIDLIAAQQQRRDRHVVYVGEQADSIRAELEAVDPRWTDTLRVVVDDRSTPRAAVLSEWNPAIGRGWIFGPWIEGDDAAWDQWAVPLVASQLAQQPPAVTSVELSGTVEHERLAGLAAELGWAATETNVAYVLAPGAANAPATGSETGVRDAVPDDVESITPLHDAEFPNTYATAAQLLERAAADELVVLVATTPAGRFAGYAAGRVQPDGNAYVDFVAVDPSARGAGAGRRLLGALVGRLLPASTSGEVHLTVQEHRTPARALYASLGFHPDIAFVGYRSPPR